MLDIAVGKHPTARKNHPSSNNFALRRSYGFITVDPTALNPTSKLLHVHEL